MSESADIRSLWPAVALHVVIFAAKIAAYLASGMMAVFAEALHTLSDIFISGFLLIAAVYSRRQADAMHMFGYGRTQNIAALVAATLFISFTSFELYREAIPRLFWPHHAEYDNLPLAMGVIVGSMLVAAIPLARLVMQKTRGAAAKAQLMELVNDGRHRDVGAVAIRHPPRNSELQHDARLELAREPGVDAKTIEIRVRDGVAVLTGNIRDTSILPADTDADVARPWFPSN